MVKKILSIVAWVITAAALVALFIFAREYYLKQPVKSVNLNIEREQDSGFVKETVILNKVGHMCEKSKIGTFNMMAVKNQMHSNPWVETSSAFIDMQGILNINVKEYDPVLRVYTQQGQSVYLTEEGVVVPSSNDHTPYVLIASGRFSLDSLRHPHVLCDTLDNERNLIDALYIYKAIKNNDFMSNCVGQIYCDNKNDFELVIKDVDARVIVGDTSNIDDKLKRMEIFMKQKTYNSELLRMKKINLKYKNQIVCTKG